MERFDLDAMAERHMTGLADRTPRQKELTDRIMLGARELAEKIVAASLEAAGEIDQVGPALDSLDNAIGAAFRVIVAPVASQAQ